MRQLQKIRAELQGGINILDPGGLTRTGTSVFSSSALDTATDNHRTSPQILQQQQERRDRSMPKHGGISPPPPPPLPPPLPFSAQAMSQQHPTEQYPFQVLEVSALHAGLVPDRTNTIPTGSEIVADALQEERVARHALHFLEQQVGHSNDTTRKLERKKDKNP